jgi:tetratricopeptide (TPR) repeat protein
MFRLSFLARSFFAAFLLGALMVRGADAPAAAPATNTTEADQQMLRTLILLQEQLRTTQREMQEARAAADAASKHAAEQLATRLATIEQALVAQEKSFNEQRQKDFDAMHSSSQITLVTVGLIAGVACLAILLTGWLQLRAVTRLTEISRQLHEFPGMHGGTARQLPSIGHSLTVTHAAEPLPDPLSGALDRLQARVQELEHTAQAMQPMGPSRVEPSNSRAATLVAKGQSLLNLDKSEEALACFDEAINADSRNVEAWIKRGTALERLQRIDEAIAAYDRAIEADQSMGTAYLFKAGVFNRQKRYAEALQCYEKALSVQKTRGNPVPATA